MTKGMWVGGLFPGTLVALTGIAVVYSIWVAFLVVVLAVAIVGLIVAIWSLYDTRIKYK